MASKGKSEKAENPSFTLFLKSVKRFESVPSIAAIVQDIFNIEVEQQQVQWFWSCCQNILGYSGMRPIAIEYSLSSVAATHLLQLDALVELR